MSTRIGVTLMTLALGVYVVIVIWLAVLFFGAGTVIGAAMGAALIVIGLLGGWAMTREVLFGLSAEKYGRILDSEGGMPEAPENLTPSGRLLPADADAFVSRYTELVDVDPADWRAHYRLGVVQDAAGRRKAARASIREAIRLARS